MDNTATPTESPAPKPQKKNRAWIPLAIAAAVIVCLGAIVQTANQADAQAWHNSSNYNGEKEQAMWTEEQKAIYREYKLKELEEIRRERRLRSAAPLAPDKMDPYYK